MKTMSRNELRYVIRLAAAGLLSACYLQPALGQAALEKDDADATAHASWTTTMNHNHEHGAGCFHAAYPSLVWEAVECKQIDPGVHPIGRSPAAAGGAVTGNGHDYVAQAAGLITESIGTFPSVTGVKTEKSVGVASFGDGGILGANEYSLQLNTNLSSTTSTCAGHSGCTVWQQFIYATDYATKGSAAVFMQYWLIGWGSSTCPSAFMSAGVGSDDCYQNSAYVTAPDVKITSLASLSLTASAAAGGNDEVIFGDGTQVYSVSGKDSMVDISSVWHQSEYNIVGDAGGSRADFNTGSSVSVEIALGDGSTAAPTCVSNGGSTGETNNLTLGKCTVAGGSVPSIKFVETH